MTSIEVEISEPDVEQKTEKKARVFGLVYLIDENPPWHISLLLGFQHYLAMTGGTLATPFILSIPMCFSNNTLVISEVMSTTFFACGIVTLLQSTFGVRLPIVQGERSPSSFQHLPSCLNRSGYVPSLKKMLIQPVAQSLKMMTFGNLE